MKMSDVGWLQRPERIVVLGSTVALSPIFEVLYAPNDRHPMHWLAVLGIVVLAVGTQTTAAQRTRHLLRLLAGMIAGAPAGALREGPRLQLPGHRLGRRPGRGAVDVHGVHPAAGRHRARLPAGAMVNFTLNRRWAFDAHSGLDLAPGGAVRVRLVHQCAAERRRRCGGRLLPNVPGMVAWLLVRGTVFVVWTMPLYRDYVFAASDEAGEPAPRRACRRSANERGTF